MKRQLFWILLCISINIFSNNDKNKEPFHIVSANGSALNTQNQQSSFIDAIASNIKVTQGLTQSEQKQVQARAVSIDQVYQQKFGANMGYNSTENMMNKSNHDFIEQLLSPRYAYSDEQICALWAEYEKRGFVKKKNKKDCEQKINKELQRRQNKHNAVKQQRLDSLIAVRKAYQEKQATLRMKSQKEVLEQRMQHAGLNPEQCIYLPQDFKQLQEEYERCAQLCSQMMTSNQETFPWLQRSAALQKTIDHNYEQSWQTISLSPQVQGYLIAYNLSPEIYTTCYGTSLQQQLHSEICSTFEIIAQKQREAFTYSMLLGIATQCNDASFWSNDFEAIDLAIGLQELASGCYKLGAWAIKNGPIYAQSITEGVIESAWDFVHMMRHPLETIQHLGQAAYFVMETIVLHNPELLRKYPEIIQPMRDERQQLISSMVSLGLQHIAHANGPARVKMITKFGADCFFQHQALKAIGTVAGIIKTQKGCMCMTRSAIAKGDGWMKYVANTMGHEPEFALVGETITQATEELETVLQKTVAQELFPIAESIEKAEIVVKESKILTRSVSEIFSEIINNCGGKIPLNNVALCEEVEIVTRQLLKQANCIMDTKLKQHFSSKWIIENGMKKRVNMNLNHVLNYEVEFIKNRRLGIMEIEFTGGHLAGSTEALAETGLIKIIDKRQLPTGCLEYDCISISGRKFTKTEFHVSWTQEMVAQHSWDLFENTNIHAFATEDKKLAKYIKLGEKELSIVMKNHEKDINIVTSVPYKIEKKTI